MCAVFSKTEYDKKCRLRRSLDNLWCCFSGGIFADLILEKKSKEDSQGTLDIQRKGARKMQRNYEFEFSGLFYFQVPYYFFLNSFNTNCLGTTDMASSKKIWAWFFLWLVGLAWCLRWGLCKNWAQEALGVSSWSPESSKTGFLPKALTADPAEGFFSNLVIQLSLTHI